MGGERERELVRVAQGPDRVAGRAAMGELIRVHQDAVYRFACQFFPSPRGNEVNVQARDCAQETFLRAWREIARFEGRSAVRTWLMGIANLVRLEMLREDEGREDVRYLGQKRDTRPEDERTPDPDDPEELSPAGASEQAERDEKVREVMAAAGLTDEERQVLELVSREDLSYKKVAARMGRDERWVQTTLQRVRARLRPLLRAKLGLEALATPGTVKKGP